MPTLCVFNSKQFPGEDPQILLQGRKPLLVADVWCLENDLQPPTVTSCGVPD